MIILDTHREILGNVWINDTFNDSKEKQTAEYTKKSSLGHAANAKKSTNIEDDNWFEEYDNIMKLKGSDQNFKFTVTNYDKVKSSGESSLM